MDFIKSFIWVVEKIIRYFTKAIDLFNKINGWSEVKTTKINKRKINRIKNKIKGSVKKPELSFISDFKYISNFQRYTFCQKIEILQNKKFVFVSSIKLYFYSYLEKLEEYNKKLHDLVFFFLFLLYNVLFCLFIFFKYNFLVLLKFTKLIYHINKYVFITNPICWFFWKHLYKIVFYTSSLYLFQNSWFGKWFNDWEWYNFFQYNWDDIYFNYQEYSNVILGCYFLLKYYFPPDYLERLEEEDSDLYWEIDEKYTYEYFSLEKKFSIFFNDVKNYIEQVYYKYYKQLTEKFYKLITYEDLQHYKNNLDNYWKNNPKEGNLDWDVFYLSENVWWNNHFKYLKQYNTFFITPRYPEQKLMFQNWEDLLYKIDTNTTNREEIIKHNMTWVKYIKWYDSYQGRDYFHDLYLPYIAGDFHLLSYHTLFFWKKAKEFKQHGVWMVDTYYKNHLKEQINESSSFKFHYTSFWKNPQWSLKDYVYYNKLQLPYIEKIKLLSKLNYNVEWCFFRKFYYEDKLFKSANFVVDKNYFFDKYFNNNKELYLRHRTFEEKGDRLTVRYKENGPLFNTAELDFGERHPISAITDRCTLPDSIFVSQLKENITPKEKSYINFYENLKQYEYTSNEFLINNYIFLKYLVIYPESLILVYIFFLLSIIVICDVFFYTNIIISFFKRIIKKIEIKYMIFFYYFYTYIIIYFICIQKYYQKLKILYYKYKLKINLVSKKIIDFLAYINSNKYIKKFYLMVEKIVDWFRDEKPQKEELKYKLLREKLKKQNIEEKEE